MSRKSIVAASKQAERDVARVLGGRRLTAGEWQGAGDVDVVSDRFVAQVKHRTNVPAYILEGLQQINNAYADLPELRRLHPTIGAAPIPLVVIRTKPGTGKGVARTLFVLDQTSFQLLASGC